MNYGAMSDSTPKHRNGCHWPMVGVRPQAVS
jgi:hypothetical protein